MRPTAIIAFLFAAAASCLPIYFTGDTTASPCPPGPNKCALKSKTPSMAERYRALNTKTLTLIQPMVHPEPPSMEDRLVKAVEALGLHEAPIPNCRDPDGHDPPTTPVGTTPETGGSFTSQLVRRIRKTLRKLWRGLVSCLTQCLTGTEHAEGCSRKNCEGVAYNWRGFGQWCPAP